MIANRKISFVTERHHEMPIVHHNGAKRNESEGFDGENTVEYHSFC